MSGNGSIGGDGAPVTRRARRDEGSTLILVLLLVVIAGLVVVPLMTYATSVLRLNTAVSERTKDVEASKAGLRVALSDPSNVFTECDDGGSLGSIFVNDTTVGTTCAELTEIGPLDALGYEVPIGAAAIQLGAEVPSIAVGGSMQSDPVPSYPATADWWAAHVPAAPAEPWDAVSGSIWLPELPRYPSTLRTSGAAPYHYDMPFGFDTTSGIECKVFFPGRYDQPVDLDGNHYYYFASGVYYFDQPITVSENADVVVGYGLEDFEDRAASERSACADDLQVATSVLNGPTVMGIDGGGATWVFGGDARLIVDDSAGSPSIRFNQRYSEEDRGGRVSIMTVNGVLNGTTADPHDVPMVNLVPASQELDTYDEDNDLSNATAINATEYVPSCGAHPADCELTDAARLPGAPAVIGVAEKYQQRTGGAMGAALITWQEAIDNSAGGALITDYAVEVSDGIGTVCDQPGDIVYIAPAVVGDAGRHECYITGLTLGSSYDVTVTATNSIGTGPSASVTITPPYSGSNDSYPDPVTDVTLAETDVDDVARITWVPGDAGGNAPITGYDVTVGRLESQPATDVAPDTFGGFYLEVVGNNPVGTRIPVVDPNGDAVELIEFEPADIPAGWSIAPVTPGSLDIIVTPPATGAPSPIDPAFYIQYRVQDPAGNIGYGTFELDWRLILLANNPDPEDATAYPAAGTPFVIDLPATDPRGRPLTATIDDSNFGPEWTFDLTGTTLTVTTTETTQDPAATPIDLDYTVDNGTRARSGTIEFHIPQLTTVDVATCSVDASPWYEVDPSCDVALPDLTDPAHLGYVARVEATNAVDVSDAATSVPDPVDGYPMVFDADPTAAPAPTAPERRVAPWTPEPIIDIRAGSGNSAHVRIGGYVSIPMGRIQIDNPDGDDNDTIEIVGGIAAGTFHLVDPADDDSIIGFLNDIVLQRRVRITSTAGTATSTAIVQVNEDGAAYAINSWVID